MMTMVAGASFSVNGVNEREILLSLRASKMIQSSQISVRIKSVTLTAHSPLCPLWTSCRTLESTLTGCHCATAR